REMLKLKFLTWDLYNTGEVTHVTSDFLTIGNLGAHLARTSGNLLQVDDEGKVTSVLKWIKSKQNKSQETNNDLIKFSDSDKKEEIDKGYIMYIDINKDKNFEPITVGREPWVTDK